MILPKKINNAQGMTLIEVAVSLVILLIVVSAIGLIFNGSGALVGNSTDIKNAGNMAFTDIETGKFLSTTRSAATINIEGGESIEVDGDYKSVNASRNNTDVNLILFEPKK